MTLFGRDVRSALRPLRPRVPGRRGALPRGRAGDEMYVIQSGRVRISKRVGGEYRPLATLGRGEFLGEMAILNGKPRTATAHVRRRRALPRHRRGDARDDDREQHRDRAAADQEARARGSTRPTSWSRSCCNPDPQGARAARAQAARRGVRRASAPSGIRASRVGRADSRARWASTSTQVRDVLGAPAPHAHRHGRRDDGAIVVADVARLHGVPRAPRDAAEVRGLRARLVDLRVIGCHGGETPKHRTSAFVLDDRVAIDAGSLTSGMELEGAVRARGVPRQPRAPRSHPRPRDHRRQPHARTTCAPLDHRGHEGDDRDPEEALLQQPALAGLHAASRARSDPAIRYLELKPEKPTTIAGYKVRAILVSHTIECCAFIDRGQGRRDRVQRRHRARPSACGRCSTRRRTSGRCSMEVSFPNREQKLATVSGHHTPETLGRELQEARAAARSCRRCSITSSRASRPRSSASARGSRGLNLTVCALGDQFIL